MRGSRTLNIPLPISCRTLECLTRSVAINALSDHPSVTLALRPSATIRKWTARTERFMRWAILLTGSYPARFNNHSSSAGVHGTETGRRVAAASPDFLALPRRRPSSAASSGVFRKSRMRCQQSPRVQSGDKLKHLVNCLALFGRPLLDPGNQQSIDCRQLLARLITLSSRSTGHCATSLQEDQGREIASCDKVRNSPAREHYSRTIESEVGCGYQRGTTFVVPHLFPLDEGAPDHSAWPRRSRVRTFSARLPMQCEAAWPLLCEAAMLGPLFIAPYLLKEHPGGKSIKRKLSPKGGEPPQRYGRESTKEPRYIARSVCDVPWSPTCEAVKGVTVVLTLLPIRWQSSTLAGEP